MSDPASTIAVLRPRIAADESDVTESSLEFVRSHLGMEVAYLSEFVGDDLVFRSVSAPGLEALAYVGGTMPLSKTYCRHILNGDLPELIPDTDDVPFAQNIALTRELPIRSHVSIPIHKADGSVYGMFCCLSRESRPSLNNRDLEVVRAFAALSADNVNARLAADQAMQEKRDAIEEMLSCRGYTIALQPIMRLNGKGTAGYEALCRFEAEPYRPPNIWFDDAQEVGLQQDLELQVIETALRILPELDEGCYLAINTSPATLASGRLTPLVAAVEGSRVVVEITEHAAIDDLDLLLMEIDRLRELGARIAIDDAGAGYSGLQQIIRLRPDVIKLDMSLTKDVDKDLARRSLTSAMVQFAHDTSASVVAEGIETEAEMRTLSDIGVEMGQGYHLGRPNLAHLVLAKRKEA